jgi:hypothetical protein
MDYLFTDAKNQRLQTILDFDVLGRSSFLAAMISIWKENKTDRTITNQN